MRNIILSMMLVPALLLGQQAEKVKDESKMGAFSEKIGTLILKDFIDIGKFNSAQIKISVITNMLTGEKIKGIRIEKESTKQYGRDAIAFIDDDEIEGLLKSIGIIKEKILPSTPANYQEVRFRSRSGFEAGCFWSADKIKWSSYLQVDRYNSESSLYFSVDELTSFENLIKDAKTKLISL